MHLLVPVLLSHTTTPLISVLHQVSLCPVQSSPNIAGAFVVVGCFVVVCVVVVVSVVMVVIVVGFGVAVIVVVTAELSVFVVTVLSDMTWESEEIWKTKI